MIRSAHGYAACAALSSFFGSFSWGGGWANSAATGSAVDSAIAWVHHSGGVAGSEMGVSRTVPASLFDGAPRYHGGSSTLGYGLAADEEAAILLKGEKVLNRQQTQAFNAGLSMSGVLGQMGAGGTNWQQPQLNVYVQSSGDTTANASAKPNGTGGFDLNIELVKMVDKGLATMGAQNSSDFVKFMDVTRSLGGNSRSLYGK